MAEPYYDKEADKRAISEWKNIWSALTGGSSDEQPLEDIPMNRRKPPVGNIWADNSEPYWPGKYESDTTVPPPEGFKGILSYLENMANGSDGSVDMSELFGSQPISGGSAYKESESIKNLKDVINKYGQRKTGIDLTPLAALTDAWTGSRFASSYTPPESEEQKQKTIITLKDRLAERETTDKQKHNYMNYLVQQANAKKVQSEQLSKLKGLIDAEKKAQTQAKEAQKQQYYMANAAQKNKKDYDIALDQLTVGLFPEVTQSPNPAMTEIYKSKINAALTTAGMEAEQMGMVPPGAGYANALQGVYKNPQQFKATISGNK